MSARRMTAREFVVELEQRGFRICEEVDGGNYLSGNREWSPVAQQRAVRLASYVLSALKRRKAA